jgi:mannose-6-phosphate isomerase class I
MIQVIVRYHYHVGLHVEKALEVTVTAPPAHPVLHTNKDTETTLAECKYFTVKKRTVNGNIEINVDGYSFSSLLCVEGQCAIGDVELKRGECVFIPANFGSVIISGNAVLLESRV